MPSLEKITCGVDTTTKLLKTVNGLVDLSISGKSKRMVTLGTSVIQQQTQSNSYAESGSISIALARSGWPFKFEPEDNFAVFGTEVQAIIDNQLPAIIASHAIDPIYIACASIGGNDARAGTPIADITAGIDTVIDTLTGLGIRMVFELLNPYGKDTSIVDLKKVPMQINDYLISKAADGVIDVVDNRLSLLDTSNEYNNALESLTYDSNGSNLHPNGRGAVILSDKWADYFAQFPSLAKVSKQEIDKFDEVYNKTGNILNNHTLNGSGTAPDSFTSGGSTWSNIGGTLANGQAVNVWSHTLAPNTSPFLYNDYLNTGAWGAGDKLQEGDKIYLLITVELDNVNGVRSLNTQLTENDGSTQYTVRGNAKALQENASNTFDNGYSGELLIKTPTLTIHPYSGSGDTNIFTRLNIEATATASGAIKVSSWEVKKVIY